MSSKTKKTYRGIIYRNPPEKLTWWKDLTKKDLKRFIEQNALVGLPICVRHLTRVDGQHKTNADIDQIAGRITRAWQEEPSGTTVIEWQFGDDTYGKWAESQVSSKVCTELSLSHAIDLDEKRIYPREVSVTAQGARPGCIVVNAEAVARTASMNLCTGSSVIPIHVLPLPPPKQPAMADIPISNELVLTPQLMQSFQAFLQQQQATPPPRKVAAAAATPMETAPSPSPAAEPVTAPSSSQEFFQELHDMVTPPAPVQGTKRSAAEMDPDGIHAKYEEQKKRLDTLELAQRRQAENRLNELKEKIDRLATTAKNPSKLNDHMEELKKRIATDPEGVVAEVERTYNVLREASQHRKTVPPPPPGTEKPAPTSVPVQQQPTTMTPDMFKQFSAAMAFAQKMGATQAPGPEPAVAPPVASSKTMVSVNASVDAAFAELLPHFQALEKAGVSNFLRPPNYTGNSTLWMSSQPPPKSR